MMSRTSMVKTPAGNFHVLSVGSTGEPVFFCHGNSLSAGTYLPFLEQMSKHGFKVFAADIRGHGFSTRENTQRITTWDIFIRDVEAVVRAISNPPVIGMGHSMGGYLIYAAAAAFPGLFSRIVLLDPIILPPWMVWTVALLGKTGLIRWHVLPRMARAKKKEFSSPKAALSQYRDKGMFRTWQSPFLEAYVASSLVEKNGAWRLCCDPAFEAQMYETVPFNTWHHAPRIRVPVLAMRGQRSDRIGRSVLHLLEKKIHDCSTLELEGLGHFFPMEDPERTVQAILPFIQDLDHSGEV